MVQYGGVDWFEKRNIPYADVDYESTMWRPDLHPLPCRQHVRRTTTADGRHSFAVLADTIPSGTVLEISLCVQMSLNVVDQFPVLWDFVIMDATTQMVCARGCISLLATSILIYAQISVPNPAGMPPSVIRRANPNHTQS